MIRTPMTVAAEITACVGDGREPTVQELGRLADRVYREIWGEQAFSWGRAPSDTATRLASVRIAQAALLGHPADPVGDAPRMVAPQSVRA